jgi:hypothetical protein
LLLNAARAIAPTALTENFPAQIETTAPRKTQRCRRNCYELVFTPFVYFFLASA